MKARLRRGATVSTIFVASTVAMIRPSWDELSNGSPRDLGDSVLITWILRWGAHALATDPIGYFHGNIFWPYGNTLAYSDLLAPFVPPFGLFLAVTGNVQLALNLTLLGMFGLSLGATYALARRLRIGVAGATVAALAFTFTGLHLSGWGHLQLSTLGLLPLAAYFVVRFFDDRSWWSAVAAGVVTAGTLLAAVYFGLIWSLSLSILVGAQLVRTRFRPGRRFVPGIAVMALTAVLLFAPAAYKYAGEAERRGYEDYRGLKARDLVTPPYLSYVWKDRFTFDGAALQEHGLYPGIVVVALGGLGLVTFVTRREDSDADSVTTRSYVASLGIAGLASVVLAIGPTALGQPMPFRAFHALVPGFNGIRVYTRLAIVFMLALALYAGIGLDRLLSITPSRLRHAAAAVLGIAVLVDLAAPLGYVHFPDGRREMAADRMLARLSPAPVVELPMVEPSTHPTDWAYVEAPRMVRATVDFRRRVNGYSGKAPPTYSGDVATFNEFPSASALTRARDLGVRYVILHVGTTGDLGTYSEDDAAARVRSLPPSARATRAGSAWVIDLGARAGRSG